MSEPPSDHYAFVLRPETATEYAHRPDVLEKLLRAGIERVAADAGRRIVGEVEITRLEAIRPFDEHPFTLRADAQTELLIESH